MCMVISADEMEILKLISFDFKAVGTEKRIVSPEPLMRLWKQKTESEHLVAGSSKESIP